MNEILNKIVIIVGYYFLYKILEKGYEVENEN